MRVVVAEYQSVTISTPLDASLNLVHAESTLGTLGNGHTQGQNNSNLPPVPQVGANDNREYRRYRG